MKFTIEVDPENNPDEVGEYLRSSFFREQDQEIVWNRRPNRDCSCRPRPCYSDLEWQKDVILLGKVEVDPDEEDGSSKLYWTRGRKTFGGEEIECRYYMDEEDGDGGEIRFRLPDGKWLRYGVDSDLDCRRDHEWDLIPAGEKGWA